LPKSAKLDSLLCPVIGVHSKGFIRLYRETYDVELEAQMAYEILGGLMRFFYLTSKSVKDEFDEDGSHPLSPYK
jgi:hypothetical protein